MRERIYLKENDSILLYRDSQREIPETWTILEGRQEGGSSVCYNARNGSHTGRLKEFYPGRGCGEGHPRVYDLLRRQDGQLVSTPENRAWFQEAKKEFLGAYRLLDEVRNSQNEAGQLLNNFLPVSQILSGGAEGTVYVWTQDDHTGVTFAHYLEEVRYQPEKNPEQKLYNILEVLSTLTDCIGVMHRFGLLHLDIKPENFLVSYDSNFDINTGNLSLFDVNSLYPIGSRQVSLSGTPGFMAPEIPAGKADVVTDLYSIGAMLFHAIVIHKEVEDGLYCEEYYSRLDHLVEESALIASSENNSNVYLRYQLTRILRLCLAPKMEERGFRCADELKQAIQEAIVYLIPEVKGRDLPAGQRLMLVSQESSQGGNSQAIMQDLLYRCPVYQFVEEGEKEIRILVAGAGTYGQSFIDICLQTLQVKGFSLHILALSENGARDREIYCSTRPALKEFVCVNGEYHGGEFEPYARLDFMDIPGGRFCNYRRGSAAGSDADRQFNQDSDRRNREITARIAGTWPGHMHYILTSLGDDDMNQQVASFLANEYLHRKNCRINYVIQNREEKEEKSSRFLRRKCWPIFIRNPITPDTIDPGLERMGFQTHLVWANPLKDNRERLWKQFREKYNYDASMAFALSIPYKLWSMGIVETDPAIAAERVREHILSGIDEESFREMVMLEHRRWVMEKVTNGWSNGRSVDGSLPLEDCLMRCSVKDNKERIHPCILHGNAKTPLKDWHRGTAPDWSWTPAKPNDELDPLDAMSVKLHELFAQEAERYTASMPMQNGTMPLLHQYLASQRKEISKAFLNYRYCIQRTLQGSIAYSRQLDDCQAELDRVLECEPVLKLRVKPLLEQMHRDMFPVQEASRFRCYKDYDEDLIRAIPGILTGRSDLRILLPIMDKETDHAEDILYLAASSMLLYPAELIFLALAADEEEKRRIQRRMIKLERFFHARNIRADIRKVFLDSVEQTAEVLAKLHVDGVDIGIDLSRDSEIEAVWRRILQDQEIGTFFFDWADGCIRAIRGCAFAGYLKTSPYLRVSDLFVLCEDRWSCEGAPEHVENFGELWSLYSGEQLYEGLESSEEARSVWNLTGAFLSTHSKHHDLAAVIPCRTKGKVREMEFLVPGIVKRGVSRLLEQLQCLGILLEGSGIRGYSSDTCRVTVRSEYDCEDILDELFGEYPRLIDEKAIHMVMDHQVHQVLVYSDDLRVQDLEWRYTEEEKKNQALLGALCRLRAIRRWHAGGNSFAYTSLGYMHLLREPNALLRMFIYRRIIEARIADDILCGCTYRLEKAETGEHLRNADSVYVDMIMTRGMRSLFIFCIPREGWTEEEWEQRICLVREAGVDGRILVIGEPGIPVPEMAEVSVIRGMEELKNIEHRIRMILEG